MAQIELRALAKAFESNVKVVNDVDLTIQDGEFLVLVGPSGCGKSTALRLIAGLEQADSGEIYIGDHLINNVPPKDRDIAMVFQNYALYPHMTVYDNMAFGLKLRKFKKNEIRERVEEAAQILEIVPLLKRKPKQLSGGQRQRVALGRAIVRKPAVFLFDEPLSNLDAKLRVQMRTEIKKLHQRLKVTMIYVTHDQVEAMTMGDRIAVMKDGIIQQVNTPLSLYDHPCNLFVAGFIGSPSMNFIHCLLMQNNGIIADEGNVKIKIPAEYTPKLKPFLNQKIIIGIRPEDISLSPGRQTTVDISVKLDVIEPMGNEAILYLTTGRTLLINRSKVFADLKPGQSLKVYLDLKQAHFFNPQSDQVI
jgi:multiple sugar transport system ATP-binding protein